MLLHLQNIEPYMILETAVIMLRYVVSMDDAITLTTLEVNLILSKIKTN